MSRNQPESKKTQQRSKARETKHKQSIDRNSVKKITTYQLHSSIVTKTSGKRSRASFLAPVVTLGKRWHTLTTRAQAGVQCFIVSAYLVLEERVVFAVKRGRELQRRSLPPSISEGKHGPKIVAPRATHVKSRHVKCRKKRKRDRESEKELKLIYATGRVHPTMKTHRNAHANQCLPFEMECFMAPGRVLRQHRVANQHSCVHISKQNRSSLKIA